MNKLIRVWLRLKMTISCFVIMSCTVNASPAENNIYKNCSTARAPASLIGLDAVMQIENIVARYPSDSPFKGAVVKRFRRDGTFTAQGTGTMQAQAPDSQQAFYGTYKYQRTSLNTATEKSINLSINNIHTLTKYTFESETSGKWEESIGNGQIKILGSFTLEPSNLPESQHLAPVTNADTNVALIIKATVSDLPSNTYPTAGLVLQTYKPDGTMVFKGFGPGTLNSHGTYTYKKISANTAVEEVIQISDAFTLPYTMVYSFETPTSGKWFQNFGDGLIKFNGTFDIFPN